MCRVQVPYPSGQKKSDLVNAYEAGLRPRAAVRDTFVLIQSEN